MRTLYVTVFALMLLIGAAIEQHAAPAGSLDLPESDRAVFRPAGIEPEKSSRAVAGADVDVSIRAARRTRREAGVDAVQPPKGKDGINVQVEVGDGQAPEKLAQPQNVAQENYLGLVTRPVPASTRAQLSDLLDENFGLLVTRVLPDSPAFSAGLQPHDILTTFNTQKISDSAMLKKVVLAAEPKATVMLGVIRAAEPQSIEVTLMQRPVSADFRIITSEDGKVPLSVRVFGRDIVIDKHGVDVPGARIRWGTRDSAEKSVGGTGYRSLTLTTKDNQTFQLRVEFTDDDGKPQIVDLEGPLDEIRKGLDNLPETLRENIREKLDRAVSGGEDGRAIRIRLRPGGHNGEKFLEIHVCQPGANARKYVSNFEFRLDEEDLPKMDELLDVDNIAEELKQLSDEIRDTVESTLRELETKREKSNHEQ